MASEPTSVELASLGMFIIDTFAFLDEHGQPTGKIIPPQIGGGGVYATIGARIWLAPSKLGMIIDGGNDFPEHIRSALDAYGPEIWHHRHNKDGQTCRSLNSYRGAQRTFEYLTPRIQITPRDLAGTRLAEAKMLHLICAASRCEDILSDIRKVPGWNPITIYETVEYACVPEELDALVDVLPGISIFSPNADEALNMLSLPDPPQPTTELIEQAALKFLEFGVGIRARAVGSCRGAVVIRAAEKGCYVLTRENGGRWIDAYWARSHSAGPDAGKGKVVDVTGAGNSFLGGLAAGLAKTGDIYDAAFYASVSASYTIEQQGLPHLSIREATNEDVGAIEEWNGESPLSRLEELMKRPSSTPR